MAELPEAARQLIDEPNLAHFVTLMPDGSPQITPVWVDHDGTHVLINTAEGRQKPRNLRRDPRVALTVVDRANAYRYVQIRGRVVDMVHEGAWDHINKLARKYMGPEARYPGSQSETRVIVKVLPEHVQVSGPPRG
ncbi:MAG TPA: PPOX class F420-dependent oxidoreductase [Dehalococcoidia bacterium]